MDAADLDEMFSGLGPVAVRRMFGGQGVYHRGLIVGIVFQGELMLKADAISAPDFADAGARRWTYEGRVGRPVAIMLLVRAGGGARRPGPNGALGQTGV